MVVVAYMVHRSELATPESSARLYTAKAKAEADGVQQVGLFLHEGLRVGQPPEAAGLGGGPRQQGLSNEALVSWLDLIHLGVLSSTFPAVDVAQVRKVESVDGMWEKLLVEFPGVLSVEERYESVGGADVYPFQGGCVIIVLFCHQVPLHIRMRWTPCWGIWSRRGCSVGWSVTRQLRTFSGATSSPSPGARGCCLSRTTSQLICTLRGRSISFRRRTSSSRALGNTPSGSQSWTLFMATTIYVRARYPVVDNISPAPGTVLLPGGPNESQLQQQLAVPKDPRGKRQLPKGVETGGRHPGTCPLAGGVVGVDLGSAAAHSEESK